MGYLFTYMSDFVFVHSQDNNRRVGETLLNNSFGVGGYVAFAIKCSLIEKGGVVVAHAMI